FGRRERVVRLGGKDRAGADEERRERDGERGEVMSFHGSKGLAASMVRAARGRFRIAAAANCTKRIARTRGGKPARLLAGRTDDAREPRTSMNSLLRSALFLFPRSHSSRRPTPSRPTRP